MTYEARVQIGDYFLTIDVEGNARAGYAAAIFFEWAAELCQSPAPAVRHSLIHERFTTVANAHRAAFRHAVLVIKAGEVGLLRGIDAVAGTERCARSTG